MKGDPTELGKVALLSVRQIDGHRSADAMRTSLQTGKHGSRVVKITRLPKRLTIEKDERICPHDDVLREKRSHSLNLKPCIARTEILGTEVGNLQLVHFPRDHTKRKPRPQTRKQVSAWRFLVWTHATQHAVTHFIAQLVDALNGGSLQLFGSGSAGVPIFAGCEL